MTTEVVLTDGRRRRRRTWKGAQVLGLALALVLLGTTTAAGEEESSDKSLDLVQQAVAVIVNDGGAERALEKAQDALDAPDQRGVDLELVRKAVTLLQSDPNEAEMQQARELLLEAAPALNKSPGGAMATGADTGTTQVIPEFRPSRGVNSAGDVVLLAMGLLLITAGLWLSHRWRPPHTSRELRRPAATTGTASHEEARP